MKRGEQIDGKRILFWNEYLPMPSLGGLLGFLGVKQPGEPQQYVRNDIPWEDRETLGKALAQRTSTNSTGGEPLIHYFGDANCRICKERLGCKDMFGYGFIWPEKAEHYILVHKVWTPDCDVMLAAVRRARPR